MTWTGQDLKIKFVKKIIDSLKFSREEEKFVLLSATFENCRQETLTKNI